MIHLDSDVLSMGSEACAVVGMKHEIAVRIGIWDLDHLARFTDLSVVGIWTLHMGFVDKVSIRYT